jgi:murein DD-endopeptidase MepM/ murein hydrolase activator NlpD
MTQLITKQKVEKRISKPRSRRKPPVPNDVAPRTKQTMPRSFRKVFKRIDPFLMYAIAGLFVVVFIFIGTMGVSSLVISREAISIGLPADDGIETLMYDFIEQRDGDGGSVVVPTLPDGLSPSLSVTKYIVKPGDSVSGIASQFSLRTDTVVSFNGIKDVYRLRSGEELRIPDMDGVIYVVRKNDNLSAIAGRHSAQLNRILDVNNLQSSLIQPGDVLFIPGARMNPIDLRRAMGTLFTKPAEGRLSSPFGMRADPFSGVRSMHNGADWANDIGTTVRASNHGTVSIVGKQNVYGKYVVIDHQGGYQSLYAHLDSYSVRKGDYVEQGSTIGKMGSTGRSTGPHLHFSIYLNDVPLDPLDFVH